jgi:hypothetical protein
MARRVQRLLARSGWAGWTARVRPGPGEERCGTVSVIGGDGRRYISGLLDAERRRVSVVPGEPRRITDLLHSADRSLLAPLFAESGASCFSFDALARRIKDTFGAERVDATAYRTTVPRGTALDDEDGRWTRYQAGCAIAAAGEPGATPDSVAVQVFQRLER